MRSALPKPLHPVAGLPMVAHVLRAGAAVRPETTVLVVGRDAPDLADRLSLPFPVTSVLQDPPRGTGDAVRRALDVVGDAERIVVLYADHPLLTPETVARLVEGARALGALATVLTVLLDDAAAYGRIERDARGRAVRIVERTDDTPERRQGPTEINSGMMVLDAAWARAALPRLAPSPASGEYYLTDLVSLAVEAGEGPGGTWPVATVAAEPEVTLGVNDRVELAAADAVARARIRRRLMLAGVTLVGPETIFVDEGVEVGPDSTLLPFTCLRGDTVVGAGCEVGPHALIVGSRLGDGVVVQASTVEHSVVADGADVGPYAHLRGGTEVGPGAHVGNFAELKNARLGPGVKVGHFGYLGDVSIGANTNIGAGTVTANFDGERKHRTEIGERVFVGSDTVFRAPVRIGDGARTGAGAVVTRDVPADTLAVGVPARIRSLAARSIPSPAPDSAPDPAPDSAPDPMAGRRADPAAADLAEPPAPPPSSPEDA